MKVLALDIAYRSGWAVSVDKPPGVIWGSFDIDCSGEEGLGRGLYNFQRHAEALLSVYPSVECIAWEKPLPGIRHSAAYDEYVRGATGLLRVEAFGREIQALPCDMKAVRRHFIGQGTGDAKRQVFQRCLTLGYQVKNDDESDAIATWDYAVGIMRLRDYAGKSQSFGGTGGGAFAAPRRAGGHRRL